MAPSKKKAASAKQKAAKAKKDAATRDLSHVLRNQPAGITVTDAQHDANVASAIWCMYPLADTHALTNAGADVRVPAISICIRTRDKHAAVAANVALGHLLVSPSTAGLPDLKAKSPVFSECTDLGGSLRVVLALPAHGPERNNLGAPTDCLRLAVARSYGKLMFSVVPAPWQVGSF